MFAVLELELGMGMGKGKGWEGIGRCVYLMLLGRGSGLRFELRGCVSLRFGVDLVCGLCWGCDWVLGRCSAPFAGGEGGLKWRIKDAACAL